VTNNLMKRLRSRDDRFPKISFTLFWCRIIKDDGSEDLLSRLHVHTSDRNEVDLVEQQWKRRNCSWDFRVGSDVLFCAAVVRIYRRKLSRVKTSCNRFSFQIKNVLDT
jgi:hypothetical protein